MTDRIDQYLEGTLGRDMLAAGERPEADAAARAVNETRAFIAARAMPNVTERVMGRLGPLAHTERPPRLRSLGRSLHSLWTPRQVLVRPAYALMGAAACLALIFGLAPRMVRTQTDAPRIATEAPDARFFVQFRLQTDASQVRLAGSFTNWEPAYALRQMAPGVWTVTVPLSPGVHDYAFVLDDEQWIADPYALHINDGFGGTNSRLTLLSPESPRI